MDRKVHQGRVVTHQNLHLLTRAWFAHIEHTLLSFHRTAFGFFPAQAQALAGRFLPIPATCGASHGLALSIGKVQICGVKQHFALLQNLCPDRRRRDCAKKRCPVQEMALYYI